MQQVLLVNPAPRPSKRRRAKNPAKRRKAASPAQLRARAAFAARAKARSKGAKVMSNPKRRRRSAKRHTTHHVRHHNPIRARRRNPIRSRRRRNPIGGENSPFRLLTPALVGALGATAVNTVLAQLGSVLPASLMTGNMQYITRIAASLGLAAIGGKTGKRALVNQMAEGSLTVTLHDAIVALSGGMGMSLSGRRGGMGVYMPGMGVQAVPNAGGNAARLAGMGAYMTGNGAPGVVVPMQRQKTLRGFNR